MPENFVTTAAECIELALAGAGCVLLWQKVLRPSARATRATALATWNTSPADFLIFLLHVVAGGFLAGVLATTLAKPLQLSGDFRTIFNGGLGQLGMLAGVALYHLQARLAARNEPVAAPRATAPAGQSVFISGAATFLIALPLVILASKLWELLLSLLGLPAEKQNLVEMFLRTDSGWFLVLLVALATIVAPITEELIFRAGLFRYLRTRLPRPLAFLLPALLFASLHVDDWKTLEGFASFAPLTTLALIFSFSYERTGRIGTPIVAHALFNLNTVLLLLAGVNT
jgi:membrane protease YdiL (CAAX protease family)